MYMYSLYVCTTYNLYLSLLIGPDDEKEDDKKSFKVKSNFEIVYAFAKKVFLALLKRVLLEHPLSLKFRGRKKVRDRPVMLIV